MLRKITISLGWNPKNFCKLLKLYPGLLYKIFLIFAQLYLKLKYCLEKNIKPINIHCIQNVIRSNIDDENIEK